MDQAPQTSVESEVRCVALQARSAEAAQWALAKLVVERNPGLSPIRVYRALRRREREASTAVGRGIAMPHARVEGVGKPEVVLGVLQDAVRCETPDGEPLRVMALVVSDPRRPEDHVSALSRVARAIARHTAA